MTSIVLTRPLLVPRKELDGLATAIINGQPMLTLTDSTRTDKILSVAEQNHVFSQNRLNNYDWLRVANASHIDCGAIAEFDGCVCHVSAHCENTDGAEKEVHLFIDNVDMGSVGTLTGGKNASFIETQLDIDYVQGQIIRLQIRDASGSLKTSIQDTVITVTTKHRG